ncbi:uncharacterized protein LOC125941611 isoform X19 [Dermacentor silvarum]|uniref:uncharacterized protein LOC125941611 isoform X19 n=1 Tax=Dermacentor silvarum TaxID=543639 RepID=UPI00210185BD|nr:uncharacterized protein LOC125941611 isoform X19 [Dermacentor silvarum]
MTEERNSGHTPPAFTSFSAEANPRTIREGAAGASSTSDYYPTISDEAWAYPLNMLNSPSDAIYVTEYVDMNENGSTAYRLPLISSDDIEANLSTGHASMEESAIFEDDARIPNDTWGGQRNTWYYLADVTSTVYGHTDMAGNGSTSYQLAVCSTGGDDAIPSASHAGMEGASASLDAIPCTSPAGMEGASASWNAIPSTCRAGMEGASTSFENNGRCTTGTEGNEQQESCGVCGVCGKVYIRLHALHRHAAAHYSDESYICETCCVPSVKSTKVLRHCQKSTGKKVLQMRNVRKIVQNIVEP